MRMARVNITLPDDLLAGARGAGLNISACAADGVREELHRRAKSAELRRYLAELEEEQGPVTPEELDAARRWAAGVVSHEGSSSSAA